MSQIKTGHFEKDGGLVYVPCGFVPSYLMLVDFHTSTNIKIYHWWSSMETDNATGLQEGFSVAEGVTARLADAGGIAAYDSGSQAPTISDWAGSGSATARSATASGTLVWPTTSGTIDTGEDADRSLVFECVTAGTTGSTEPVWNPVIGQNSPSDNGVIWQCVAEPTYRGGYEGFRVAAALMTNGQEAFFLAIQADEDIDYGDADAWASGIAAPGQF